MTPVHPKQQSIFSVNSQTPQYFLLQIIENSSTVKEATR